MILNSAGPIYKQTMEQPKKASQKPIVEPEELKSVQDEQVVAEEVKEPVKAKRASKAKTKKEDK